MSSSAEGRERKTERDEGREKEREWKAESLQSGNQINRAIKQDLGAISLAGESGKGRRQDDKEVQFSFMGS